MIRQPSTAITLCAALILSGATSAAASSFPKGVFSSEKGCPSRDIHSKGEPTFLNAEGLEAIEWNCEFVDVRSAFGELGWLINSACNAPGEFYPQQFVAIVEERDAAGPTRIKLTDGPHQPVETLFYRCPSKR